MEFLPVEVITHILRFVGVSDRKEAALVCRRWYEASLDPILLRDTVVTFHAPSTSGDAFTELGRRRTPHLVLDEIDGSFSSKSFLLNSCSHLTANLESVSLKGSNITESLFTELMSRCVCLQSLDISFCNSLFMSGLLLSKEEDMQRLRKSLAHVRELNLSSIRYLTDTTFKRVLHICPNVQKLYLNGNKITFHTNSYYGDGNKSSSVVLTYVTVLECLKERQRDINTLDLSRTTIDDDALAGLARIPELRIKALHLVSCRELTSAGIAVLVKEQNEIETLDLSLCIELGDGALGSICEHLHNLRHLYLNKCRLITDGSAQSLCMLYKLERLEIASNFIITAAAFSKGLCKGKLPRLRHVNLSCCSLILRDSFIVNACKTLSPTLTHLDLSSSKITDAGLQYLCTYMTSLRTLILKWNSEISDDGLLAVPLDPDVQERLKHELDGSCKCTRKTMGENVLNLPKVKPPKSEGTNSVNNGVPNVLPVTNLRCLQHLDLSCCPKVTDNSIKQFVFPDIRVLRLESNPAVSDEALVAISKNLASLEELHVSQCGHVTDAGLIPVVRKLRRLRALSLASCDQVTDRFLQALQTYCARLKHLEVSMCSGISHDMMDKIEKNMKYLQSVNRRLIGSHEGQV